ncbi:MAG: clostripain-related cysteine peptidase [Vallitaleaceae bacterium]|jgi:hypothetical protein|nr:clostripain-related cysteine peptidase [Vallitaleaceae bacterium]
MKKIISVFIIVALLIGYMTPVQAAGTYDYTLMIYMNGSDLESGGYAGTNDFLEMIAANITNNVTVIVQTGGTLDWHTDEYGLPSVSANQGQRWRVTDTTMELLETKGALNMGQSSTLKDFVAYGINNYNANKYGLIMWNHGSGPIFGFGADEYYQYDSLTVLEMATAFQGAYQQTNTKLDFVGFDACLMGTIEVGEMLSPYANYLVASEELEPGHGWDYTAVVNAINNGRTGRLLGKAIADGFLNHSQVNMTAKTITLSVVDLTKIDQTVIALETLLNKLKDDLSNPDLARDIIKARLVSESYGEGSTSSDNSDLVDLADYANNLPVRYKTEVQALISAIDSSVVYNINSDYKPDAGGIAMYMPATALDMLYYAESTYQYMGFSSAYYNFLVAYKNLLENGGASELSVNEDINQYDTVSNEVNVQGLDADDDNFYMNMEPGDIDLLDSIYTVFGYVDDVDDIVYLGKDMIGPASIIDDGTIIGETLDYWILLEDYFVPMYFMGYDEKGYLYYFVPIIINDEDYDLIVLFSEENPDGTILGARPYSYSSDGITIFNRNLIQLKVGDEVGIIYEYDTLESGSYVYSDWFLLDTFRFDGVLNFEWDVIPDGTYAYSFEIIDIYQNYYYTDWIFYTYYDMYLVDKPNYQQYLWDVLDELTYNNQTNVSPYAAYYWITDMNDLPSNWAIEYIDNAYNYGLSTQNTLKGFTDEITRGEFCELVINMYELAAGINVPVLDDEVFLDTANADVLKAYQLGVVTGYSDGTFREDALISRQELITMFHRALIALDEEIGYSTYDQLNFADASQVASFAKAASEFMVAEGLINGVGGNNLAPLDTATKEVALKIVLGVYEYYWGL